MDLESATKKALDYLKSAGYAAAFMRLVDAVPERGGWRLTFMDPLFVGPLPRYVELRMDESGSITGLRTVKSRGEVHRQPRTVPAPQTGRAT